VRIIFYSLYGHVYKIAEAREKFDHIPVIEPEDLVEPDGITVRTPTRFGNMAAKMRNSPDLTKVLRRWQNLTDLERPARTNWRLHAVRVNGSP